jgi:hypothetical protein
MLPPPARKSLRIGKTMTRSIGLEAHQKGGAGGAETEGQEEEHAQLVEDAFEGQAGLAGHGLGLLDGHDEYPWMDWSQPHWPSSILTLLKYLHVNGVKIIFTAFG